MCWTVCVCQTVGATDGQLILAMSKLCGMALSLSVCVWPTGRHVATMYLLLLRLLFRLPFLRLTRRSLVLYVCSRYYENEPFSARSGIQTRHNERVEMSLRLCWTPDWLSKSGFGHMRIGGRKK